MSLVWAVPGAVAAINLLIIWFMPKRMSGLEIYATWFTVAAINLSVDIILCLYFKLYEINGPGIQLWVHVLELVLGPSFGILYVNFMPESRRRFLIYAAAWLVFAVLLEALLVHVRFIVYMHWHLAYSACFYACALLFARWHRRFMRRMAK
ncbi:hypothetical protein I8J29_03490 [Paenibacillus sp. MWE-103]|uniref:Uncharacterized protein n=1 Tax=Paenibacillus artemisiicola TaxID=1172618 RepID=A0ABS3W4K1_9BACL|nr:hypothetical protein [Paenibacillus artemisiicola]MBO7743243.1 hypothetical protein [Paenibacillus artemisiicola]